MEYTITKNDNATADLNLTFSAEDIEKAYQKAYIKASQTFKAKGFRVGKAPMDMVKKALGDSVAADAVNILLNDTIEELYPKFDFVPLRAPKVEIEKFERHNTLVAKAVYERSPEVELGEYKNLPMDYEEIIVTDDDIQSTLENIQFELSKTILKEQGEVAENSNMVNVDVDTLDENGNTLESTKGHNYYLGLKTNQKGLDDNIIGMKAGETKSFEFTYTDDYHNKDLAGKQYRYRVTANEVYNVVKPELSDELANEWSGTDGTTLEDLKNTIKNQLKGYYIDQLKNRYYDELIKQVIEKSKFMIPTSMINEETARLFHNALHEYKLDHHMTMEKFAELAKTDVEKLKSGFDKQSIFRIQSYLVIHSISEREHLHLTQDEFKLILEEVERRKSELKNANRDQIISSSAENFLYRKVLEFLFANSNKVNKKEISIKEAREILEPKPKSENQE